MGAVLSRGLGLVATIVVARILGKEGFGELGIIQSTVGMFGTFAGFGLGLTATKHVAELREKDPERASRILALSAVVAWGTGGMGALALALTSPWLAAHTLAAPHLAPELRIGSLLVLLGAVNGAQTGALSGFEAFKRIAQLNLWAGLINFPCLTVGCWVGGLKGAVWGLVVAQALGWALNRWGLAQQCHRSRVPIWSDNWRRECRVLLTFSVPTVFASLLVSPSLWLCQAMLVRQPDGYQQIAEYSVGHQWRALVQYLPGLLCAAYLPVAASMASESAHQRRRLMWGAAAASAASAAAAALALLATAPLLLGACGPGFEGAKLVVALLLCAGIVDSANTVLAQTVLASDLAWARLASNGFWAATLIASSCLLVPSHKALGLAGAVVVAQSLHLMFQFPLAIRAAAKKK